MKRIAFSLLIACTTLTLSAKTYYASPTGSGNGNSYSTPCSLSSGLSKLTAAGDTLYLLGGQYDFSSTQKIYKKTGTEKQNIVICNYKGEQPIFDFRQQPYGKRGIEVYDDCKYVTLSGITIRYAGKNGLYNEGSYCTFSNLDVYGNGDSGVQMKNGGYNRIINVDSHHNFDYKLDKSGNLTAVDFGGNADGFADKQHSGAANTYIGCRAWNNSDDGWDCFQRITDNTTIIENCICFRNGPQTYDMRNHGRYQTDKDWFNQFAEGKNVTDADGNKVTVTLQQYPNMGNGNGFKVGGDETKHQVQLQLCLAVDNTVKGFDQNNNAGNMTLYNCSAYINGTDYGFNNSKGTLLIRNCISYKSKGNNAFKTSTTTDHNSWNTDGIKVSDNDFLSLDTTEILSARQADGTLPTLAFMHLKEDSKLIDAGVDVGLAFAGKAPDMGCYEYGDNYSYPALLTCIAGQLTQSVRLGNAITDITLQWGGGATGVTYTALPDGIKATENKTAKTLTLSGTPATIGTSEITVTTTGDATPKQITVSITAKNPTAPQIAYVTYPDSEADRLILDYLNADNQFTLDILDANSNHDYTGYNLILISPVPKSDAAGLDMLKGIDKPMLVLKPFVFKSTIWNWGTPQNTADKAIRPTAEHPVFAGLSDADISIFSQVNRNAVTCITEWYNSTVTPLATTLDGTGTVIAEAAAGTGMNGTVLSQPMLMIGISEYSTIYLTNSALQLIDNACRHLLGLDPSTSISDIVPSACTIRQTGNLIEVLGADIRSLSLYNLSGQLLHSAIGSTLSHSTLPCGIYLLRIDSTDGGNSCRKIIIR